VIIEEYLNKEISVMEYFFSLNLPSLKTVSYHILLIPQPFAFTKLPRPWTNQQASYFYNFSRSMKLCFPVLIYIL